MIKAHPSLGDPGDVVDYFPLPLFSSPTLSPPQLRHAIRVRVPLADIPTIFAHRQWRAGMLLADLIYCGGLALDSLDVLELGAGTGLPSIVASNHGKAKLVVATDYDSPSLISTLRANVKYNTGSTSKIKVAGHTWAKAIDDLRDFVASGDFNVILLADCIWDDLSHASLIQSITALLCREERSRVYMVSGLHTGRAKIVSFLRRAHRQGLRLIPFPSLPNGDWPQLDEAELSIQRESLQRYANEDALCHASKYIIEMQILSDETEEITTVKGVLPPGAKQIWQAKSVRLSDVRRTFVVEERDEERIENQGVHVRNRWMTFFALAWR